VKSRYQGLRAFGTIALIIAWILLILGILSAVGTWLGINALSRQLTAAGTSAGGWSLAVALPPLLFGIFGFIQFYIIGKVLRLLVDLDETALDVQQKVQAPEASAPAGDGGADISGELKRQAKLITSNLEATQALQQQIGSIQSRIGALAAPAVVAPVAAAQAAAPSAPDQAPQTD
jgi:hypothetical protein